MKSDKGNIVIVVGNRMKIEFTLQIIINFIVASCIFFMHFCNASEVNTKVLYSSAHRGKVLEIQSFISNGSSYFAAVRENSYAMQDYQYRLFVNTPKINWIDLGVKYEGNASVVIGSIKWIDEKNIVIPMAYKNRVVIFNYGLVDAKITKLMDIQVDLDVITLSCIKDDCYIAGSENGKMNLLHVETIAKKPSVSKVDLYGFNISGFRDIYVEQEIFVAADFKFNDRHETGLLNLKKGGSLKYVKMPDVPQSAKVKFIGYRNKLIFVSINEINQRKSGKISNVFVTDFDTVKYNKKFPGEYINSSVYMNCSNFLGAIYVQPQEKSHILRRAILDKDGLTEIDFKSDNQRLFTDIQVSAGKNVAYVALVYNEIREFKAYQTFTVLEVPSGSSSICSEI